MLKELNKYKYIEKSKSELEADKILNNIQTKWMKDNGYETIYRLGAILQLKCIAQVLRKDDVLDKNDILSIIKTYKEHDDVSDLVNLILEEFDYKEN